MVALLAELTAVCCTTLVDTIAAPTGSEAMAVLAIAKMTTATIFIRFFMFFSMRFSAHSSYGKYATTRPKLKSRLLRCYLNVFGVDNCEVTHTVWLGYQKRWGFISSSIKGLGERSTVGCCRTTKVIYANGRYKFRNTRVNSACVQLCPQAESAL